MAKKKDRALPKRAAVREVNLKLDPSVVTQLDGLVGIANAADPGSGKWFRADLVEFAVWKLHQSIRGDVESFKRLKKRRARLEEEAEEGVFDRDVVDNALKEAREAERNGKGQ